MVSSDRVKDTIASTGALNQNRTKKFSGSAPPSSRGLIRFSFLKRWKPSGKESSDSFMNRSDFPISQGATCSKRYPPSSQEKRLLLLSSGRLIGLAEMERGRDGFVLSGGLF